MRPFKLLFTSKESGTYCLVDVEDYDMVAKYDWHVSGGYFTTWAEEENDDGDKVNVCLRLHKLLCPDDKMKGCKVDHVNGNKLDNRKENLRLVSNAANTQNQHGRRGFSKYKGVSYVPATKNWRAIIYHEKHKIMIGLFASEEAAAKAYDGVAEKLYGAGAYQNFGKDYDGVRRLNVQCENCKGFCNTAEIVLMNPRMLIAAASCDEFDGKSYGAPYEGLRWCPDCARMVKAASRLSTITRKRKTAWLQAREDFLRVQEQLLKRKQNGENADKVR